MSLTNHHHRPVYHFLPEKNWMNDPNGLIHWNGEYHMFYQYNPNAAVHGDIHWGHAVSRDLAHWQHLPIALAPSPDGPDAGGCWSGCAVEHDGAPAVVYTGFNEGRQTTCLAFGSADLRELRKYPGNPVIAAPPEDMQTVGFRDHTVWMEDGQWHMLIGSGEEGFGPRALMYRSGDLIHWEYLHPLTDGSELKRFPLYTGNMWECPSFFELDGRHVLIFSAWEYDTLFTGVYVGRYENQTFKPETLRMLDYGRNGFYAPQTMLEAPGGGRQRRLIWGWLQEARPVEAALRTGWSGAMSLPRELTVDDQGHLRQQFVPELAVLRAELYSMAGLRLSPRVEWSLPVNGRALEMRLQVRKQGSGRLGLSVLRAPDGGEQTVIWLDWGANEIVLDRSRASDGQEAFTTPLQGKLLQAGDVLDLVVYVDGSIIECLVDGYAALSGRAYPLREESTGVALIADGCAAQIEGLDVWQLQGIW